MTSRYFRVRNGLALGTGALNINADTGEITTNNGTTILDGTITASTGNSASLTNSTTDSEITVNDTETKVVVSGNTWNFNTDGTLDAPAGGAFVGDLTGDVTGQVSDISNHSTTDLVEGTNLYYTSARANSDFDTRLATKSTTNLAEGTNLYYTSARANSDFDTRLATKTTDNLNEGSTNQYFTNARARQAISATDSGGDGSLSYDNSTGVITYTGPSSTEVRAHFSAGTGVTLTSGQIAIGQSVGTADNVQFGNITSTGTIKNAGKGIYAGSNRTYTGGDTTDVFRLKGIQGTDSYLAYTGLLATNADKTTTLGARPAVVLRGYGQNITGGTTTTTANSQLVFETSRGTPATPLAVGSGEALGVISGFSNAGTTAGTPYWVGDNYSVPPAQIIMASSQAHSATPSASATFTANFTASTTMTVTAVASGTLTAGHEIRYNSGGTGSFSGANTFSIVAQQTSDQSPIVTTTATSSSFPTAKLTLASASLVAVGQLVSGTGIPISTFVGSVSGTTITLVNSFGAPQLTTANLSSTTLNFYTPGGTGSYTINASPYTGTSNSVSVSSYATTLGTTALIRTQPNNLALTSQSRVNSVTYTPAVIQWQAQTVPGTSHFVWTTWTSAVSGGTNKTLGFLGPNSSGFTSERFTVSSYANGGNQLQFTSPEINSDGATVLSLNHRSRGTFSFPVFNFTNQRTTDNVNYTPTLTNDTIGAYKFNGNAYTGTSPGVPAGPASQISCYATEDWTSTANGAGFRFSAIKTGTLTDLTIIDGKSDYTTFRSDQFAFRDSNDTTFINATPTTATITPEITLANSNGHGGSGYAGFITLTNQSGGASNVNKYIRMNNTGDLEIVNSAYSAVAFSLRDDGSFTAGGSVQANSGFFKYPVYTRSALTAITGQVGWTAAVSDASGSGGGAKDGQLAYWDATSSPNRWSYVHDNSAV